MSAKRSKAGGQQFDVTKSAGATFQSKALNTEYLDNVMFQAVFTGGGSPIGTLTVETSANHVEDLNGNVTTAGNWNTIQSVPGTDDSLAVSGDGTYTFNIALNAAPFMRLVYTRTSGTATVKIYVGGKSL